MNAVALAVMALIATTMAASCTSGSSANKALATCALTSGSKDFDLTAAFTSGGKPYLTSLALDQAYVFYVTAIMPGLNNGQNLPMCQFADGFTDSNSGAQADNTPTGGTCWSTGDVNAETWTYDEPSETMTIESIEGQDDRKTKLTVICSKDAKTPVITTLPEDPPKEYNFQIMHQSACLSAPAPSGGGSSKKGTDVGAIMCAVFFGVLAGYFLIGFLVLKFGMKKEGAETVPNHTFWFALPGLVKDGFSFTVSSARGQAASTSYEKI